LLHGFKYIHVHLLSLETEKGTCVFIH
jgi:hypothetical protein